MLSTINLAGVSLYRHSHFLWPCAVTGKLTRVLLLLVFCCTLIFSEIIVHLKEQTTAQFAKNWTLFCGSPRVIIMSRRVGEKKEITATRDQLLLTIA